VVLLHSRDVFIDSHVALFSPSPIDETDAVVTSVELIPKNVLVALPDGVSLVNWRRTKQSNMAVDKDIAAM
jgi:hypothetical protein